MSGRRASHTLIAAPVTRPDVAYPRHCALRHGTPMVPDVELPLQVGDRDFERVIDFRR
jgi:hypothetical protein